MINDTHHIIEIPEIGFTKYLPKELQYCNNEEFLSVAGLLYKWQCGVITYEDFRIQATYVLLNLKKGKRKVNSLKLDEALSNVHRISVLLDSFFNATETNDKRIKLNVIDNPVTSIRPIIARITGPKARLSNTTFGQYEDANNAYQMYYRTQDEKHLWQLFFIYYQGATYKKERTEILVTKYKKYVSIAAVFAFFLFFESFQSYVTQSQLVIEGNVIDLSILFKAEKNASKSELPGLGTKSLAFHISKTGITGNLKETREQPLWEILLLLYDLRKTEIDEAAEVKRNETTS